VAQVSSGVIQQEISFSELLASKYGSGLRLGRALCVGETRSLTYPQTQQSQDSLAYQARHSFSSHSCIRLRHMTHLSVTVRLTPQLKGHHVSDLRQLQVLAEARVQKTGETYTGLNPKTVSNFGRNFRIPTVLIEETNCQFAMIEQN
jgi:hypothetical protein